MVEPLGLSGRVRLSPYDRTPGEQIAEHAFAIARERGRQYARANAPVSPEPRLTGNRRPGETPLEWLRGENKCNQFVGDVLFGAGYRMPLFQMDDGSFHYMHAAALPGQREFFSRITARAAIEPGDILVIRHPGRGENSAHVEVVTTIDRSSGALATLGAHPQGIEPRRRWLGSSPTVTEFWSKGNDRWFILRPQARFSRED